MQGANAGVYQVVVSNTAGSVTSNPATLTVLMPPLITQSPQSQTVVSGTSVTWTVTATGSTPLSYQWKLNGFDLAGATNATLALSNVQPTDGGLYSVSVRNEAGAVTSPDATLSIAVPADVPPRIDSITLDARVILLQFTVEPTYQLALEFKDSVASAEWSTLTNVSARLIPLRIIVSDAIAGPQRFYRLTVTGRIR